MEMPAWIEIGHEPLARANDPTKVKKALELAYREGWDNRGLFDAEPDRPEVETSPRAKQCHFCGRWYFPRKTVNSTTMACSDHCNDIEIQVDVGNLSIEAARRKLGFWDKNGYSHRDVFDPNNWAGP